MQAYASHILTIDDINKWANGIYTSSNRFYSDNPTYIKKIIVMKGNGMFQLKLEKRIIMIIKINAKKKIK